ncbi:MAG: peptidylprolyl isomerase [Kosmotogaceae bacterium]
MRKLLVVTFVVLLTITAAFSADYVAKINEDSELLPEEYWVTKSELSESVEQTVSSLKQQGVTFDEYFGSNQLPSIIGLRYSVLQSLFDRNIIRYYADVHNLSPDATSLETEKEEMLSQYTSDEQALSQIEQAYGSIDVFSDLIYDNLFSQKQRTMVQEEVVSQDKESLVQYFEQEKQNIKEQYETVTASHILLSSEASAVDIKEKIQSGELDFSEAASDFSEDEASAKSSGGLGTFSHGEMIEPFEDVAFAATPNVITGPIETDFGYHLILVQDKNIIENYEDLAGNDEAFEQFKNDYMSAKFNEWLENYKTENNIDMEIIDPRLKAYKKLHNAETEEERKALMYELEEWISTPDFESDPASDVKLANYIQLNLELIEDDTDEYKKAISKMYKISPESWTVASEMYRFNQDRPDVSLNYNTLILEEVYSLLSNQQMVQMYIQQYGQQNFVSMILNALKNVDSEFSKIIESDASNDIKIKALRQELSTLEILLSLDQNNQEQYLEKMQKFAEKLYELDPTEQNKELLDTLESEAGQSD